MMKLYTEYYVTLFQTEINFKKLMIITINTNNDARTITILIYI